MPAAGTPVDSSAALALDANALASLKAQAAKSPEKALSAAAGQFEALFVSMVLKSMRDALPQDGPLASDTTKTYTAMFDQQLAQKLSDRGIGLRKSIEQQLARAMPAPASADATPSAAPAAAATTRRIATYAQPVPKPREPDAPKSAAKSPSAGVASTVSAFIDKLRPYAESAAKALGVPAQFLLAQAGLETGWGKSLAKTADGASSHNLFGVKATRRWSGTVAPAKTIEYVDGNATRTTQAFRAYGSDAAAFDDIVRVLKGSRRYASALAQGADASRYAKSLQRAGYATDPAYADKLTRAIALVNRHTTASSSPPQVIAGGADTRSDRA